MKKIYVYIIGFSSLFIVNLSQAQNEIVCNAVTNCIALGYTKTATECAFVGRAVKCPFDVDKVFCVPFPKKAEVCDVGSILYSDKSCSKAVIIGKTPIAIVFDKNRRLATALEHSPNYMFWGFNGRIVGDECQDSTALNSCGWEGEYNTYKIIDGLKNDIDSAVGYCVSYSRNGTAPGDWFFPSLSELKLLYNVKDIVNASLRLLGERTVVEGAYWSSTVFDYDNAWYLSMNSGDATKIYKHLPYKVRPVISF